MSIYRDSKIHHDRDGTYTVMSIGVDFCKISEAFEMPVEEEPLLPNSEFAFRHQSSCLPPDDRVH